MGIHKARLCSSNGILAANKAWTRSKKAAE